MKNYFWFVIVSPFTDCINLHFFLKIFALCRFISPLSQHKCYAKSPWEFITFSVEYKDASHLQMCATGDRAEKISPELRSGTIHIVKKCSYDTIILPTDKLTNRRKCFNHAAKTVRRQPIYSLHFISKKLKHILNIMAITKVSKQSFMGCMVGQR